MPARFVIQHQPSKGYHFNLLATNGRVIVSSEHYESRRALDAGIESVRRNAANALVVDQADVTAARAARKSAAKKTAAKKTTAKKTVARKSAAKKVAAKKTAARTSGAKRTTAKRTGTKKAAARVRRPS